MPIHRIGGIRLDDGEIEETFIRSSGPGGQNVNKVATAVQLRFDVRHSPSLPTPVRQRLERLAGRRLTGEGVLVIVAREHRSQELNRVLALSKLIDLIRRAAIPPRVRRATRPSLSQRRRRLEDKGQRSATKRARRADPED